MKENVPNFLYEMLVEQYGENIAEEIVSGYVAKRATTLRVNTLKTEPEKIKKELEEAGIEYEKVQWSKEALIIKNTNEADIRKLDMYNNGEIYLQSLSSMLPVIVLEPKAQENILDMAAAPGGKTTQMAAMSEDKALITACEKNKIRADRLKYNIEKQGAKRISVLVEDARNLNDFFSFDKILLDAPCSGSGTISLADEKLEKNFTEELIKRAEKTQMQLLKKAVKVLKPGHEMIYSTCSILKNENEENVKKILKSANIEIVPINKELFKGIPLLPSTIEGTITVCPNELYEGFFIAKLKKK